MAKRQCQLTDEERQALGQAERQTRDAYELRRLQAVRLYGSGIPTAEIMRLIQVSDRRVREWAQKYRQEGLDGLQSQWQGENALKLSREQRADLRQRLQQYRPDQVIAPDIRISQGQFWTVSDLQIVENAIQSYQSFRTLTCRNDIRKNTLPAFPESKTQY